MAEISRNEFDEWKSHPITKEVFLEIASLKQKYVEDTFLYAISNQSALPAVIGRIAAYDDLLLIDLGED